LVVQPGFQGTKRYRLSVETHPRFDGKETKMTTYWQVHLFNMGYALSEQFPSLETAIAGAKEAGFEAAIYKMKQHGSYPAGYRVATWSPISGVRYV
jgi:hypothetical protein